MPKGSLPDKRAAEVGNEIASDGVCKELEKCGMTFQFAALKHKELMEANKTVSCVAGKDAGAGTVDFVDVPDWSARAKGLDMYYSVRGAYAAKKLDATIRGDVSLIAQDVKKPKNSGRKVDNPVEKSSYQPQAKKRKA